MLASNTMMDYWFRQSPRITTSQIWCPAWGHPQSFVWSGTACMGETRKHTFPNAWDMGPPTSLKMPGKPSGLLAALASLSLTFCPEILVWTWSLSLGDGFARTGTHLQIITVHPKMHSTVSKKYQTSCVWDLLPSTYCFLSLSWLENWPFRTQYTV